MTTDFRLYLLTWNVGETNPPKDLTHLVGLDGKTLPNLYAVGLQEMKSSTASRVSDLVFEDVWTTAVTDCLSARNYVRIKCRRLMGLHLSVYIRRVDLPYITNVESECTKTGLGGLWGNKGAVGIRLDAFGVNICIMNSHFTAHMENFAQRLEDYNMALETQRFRDKETGTILDHDYVFWMGDLNFRIDGLSNEEVRRRAKEDDIEYLVKYDQLSRAMKEEMIFVDFFEGPLKFPPTFKFDVGTNEYDSSTKNRVPSWCDRVLWRVHEDSYEGVDLTVEQLNYRSIMDETSSDHKPVVAEFIIQVLKTPPELPVMFEPMNCWCQQKDNEVSYVVSSNLTLNSRDWIGLFRSGYKSWSDYVTYVWASGKGEDMEDGSHMYTVTFESRYLQRLPSDTYYLLYFSVVKNCVVGYSDMFRLVTTEESSSSSEESSDLMQAFNSDGLVGVCLSNNSLGNYDEPVDQVDNENEKLEKPLNQEILKEETLLSTEHGKDMVLHENEEELLKPEENHYDAVKLVQEEEQMSNEIKEQIYKELDDTDQTGDKEFTELQQLSGREPSEQRHVAFQAVIELNEQIQKPSDVALEQPAHSIHKTLFDETLEKLTENFEPLPNRDLTTQSKLSQQEDADNSSKQMHREICKTNATLKVMEKTEPSQWESSLQTDHDINTGQKDLIYKELTEQVDPGDMALIEQKDPFEREIIEHKVPVIKQHSEQKDAVNNDVSELKDSFVMEPVIYNEKADPMELTEPVISLQKFAEFNNLASEKPSNETVEQVHFEHCETMIREENREPASKTHQHENEGHPT